MSTSDTTQQQEPVIVDSCDVRDWLNVLGEWMCRIMFALLGAVIVWRLWRRHEHITREAEVRRILDAIPPAPEAAGDGEAKP